MRKYAGLSNYKNTTNHGNCSSRQLLLYLRGMNVVAYLTRRLVLSILSIALLSSQVCNVICIYADGQGSTAIKSTRQSDHTSHCHRGQEESKDESRNHSEHCPKHENIVSLQPDSPIKSELRQQHFIQILDIALISFSGSLAHSTTSVKNKTLFRPPPPQSSSTVLRI
jgi:hypothetical protein